MSSPRRSGFLRRLRLRDVVLFTLPPFLAGVWLIAASTNDYRRLTQFDDWWSSTARVDHFAWWRVRSALRLPRAMSLDEGLSAEDTRRALVDLRVDRNEFDRIASDPVGHAGESVKAFLGDETDGVEVELKLRGDTSVHWTGEKKTLAIKSARGEEFHDNEVNVFSCKEVLAQFAANSMAQDFGLLAPPTTVVPVFLNQRFYGMFRTFAPLDETFLRNAGRTPGNIFRGDTAERGDYFKGLPRELFVNPYIWDRAAMDARTGADGMSRLYEFVARVNRAGSNEIPISDGDESAVESLYELIDRDEIARLLALDLCVGDPWHTSGVHNHFWYEDPASATLHPIPWDLRMLDLEHPPPNAQFNRFWRAALKDPRVFAQALGEIHRRNADGQLFKTVSERVEAVWDRYRDGFEFDRLRCGPPGTATNPDVGSLEEVLGTLRKNLATLERWCGEASASVAITRLDAETLILDVLVDGRSPIELAVHPIDRSMPWAASLDTDLNGVPSDADRAVTGLAYGPFFNAAKATLLPGVRAGQRLEPEGIPYRFFLKGAGLAPGLLTLTLRNELTRESVVPGVLQPGSALREPTSVHPWSFRETPTSEKSLAGEIRLTRDLEVPENTRLTIAPGTRIVLDPDVSILCKGRVQAWGTEAEPITISSADPRRPWGTLALSGDGASRSSFANVHFSGGGGAARGGVEYTGMVCVHGARDVLFRDAEFSANLRCDDLLHADSSDVTISHGWFHDANADSIDLGVTSGTIERSTIERAGRDGIALTACSPRILGNEIRDVQGSGISVRGNASPLVFASTITGCARGIEASDRSAPTILDDTLAENRVGVAAALSDANAGRGGWPRLARLRLSGNASDFQLDKRTRSTELDPRAELDDGAAEALAGANLEWLYALNGLALEPSSPGAVPTWRETPPALVLQEERFPASWSAPAATWRRGGGVTSLRLDEDCLVVRMNLEPGELARDVAWDLTDDARSWLVVECAAVGIKSAHVRVGLAGGAPAASDLRVPLELSGDAARFRATILPLPAGKYDMLTLELEPRTASGRLHLSRWKVVRLPAAR